jgi:hypothetical protein
MSDLGINPLEDTESAAAQAYAEERRENIRTFVRTNPEYYIRMFDKIGASSKFTPTFNMFAGLFGPIWFGARGLWNWALPFLIIEALALVQMARGMFGDLGAEAMARWSCAANNWPPPLKAIRTASMPFSAPWIHLQPILAASAPKPKLPLPKGRRLR